MEITRLVDERASCRAFRPEPVDDTLVDAVLARAQQAPSWCNTQPWQVHLLQGEALTSFAKALGEHVSTQPQRADLGLPVYTGAHAERRRQSGYGLYTHLGIDRDDHAARGAQMLRNFTFFDAPHLAVLTTDADLGAYGVLDCGSYLATVTLLLADAGLGTCALGSLAMYSDAVRAHLDLPPDRLVVAGLAFGHPDTDAHVNHFRTTRADLTQVVTRLG